MSTAAGKRNNQQKAAILRLVLLLLALVAVNMLATRFHVPLDLTEEKRFTLSPATKRLLSQMDETAVVDVFLKGKFPAGFQRLSEAVREKLQFFQNASGGKVVFRFEDPVTGKSEEEKKAIVQNLFQKGIEPMMLNQQNEEGYKEQIVFPYALVHYKGGEMPVRLLERHFAMSPAEQLNMSEAQLEYKFASAIRDLGRAGKKPDIAYIMGNGEALSYGTWDALHETLPRYYNLDTVDLTESFYIPIRYKAIVICKPTVPFSEKDKYKIDQYVMRGGRVLWLLDALQANMDSLQQSETFLTRNYDLNLDDMLFKYGVRVNPVLIEDLQCESIPVTVGYAGNEPQIELRNWQYFPLLQSGSKHPIVNNMNLVLSVFANSLDTVGAPGIDKTILLTSSKYSRTAPNPVRVSLSMLRFPPRTELFNHPYSPAAVLLEGKFKSVFQNRMAETFLDLMRDSLKYDFKAQADTPGRMIVVADGDVMLNDFSGARGPLEMGFWKFTNERYANKTFLLNSLEYLTDESGILEARSKESRLRMLDAGKVKATKNNWQILNLALPVGLVLLFAAAWIFFRKRKYTAHK